MKKVLIAYSSLTGVTEKMAEYIAEGVRFSGRQVIIKKLSDIKNADDLAGYDGYIFGSPTFSLDVPESVKTFPSIVEKVNWTAPLALTHMMSPTDTITTHRAIIFDTLQNEHMMEPFQLGPLNLLGTQVETSEGMRACQDYGKVFGETLVFRFF